MTKFLFELQEKTSLQSVLIVSHGDRITRALITWGDWGGVCEKETDQQSFALMRANWDREGAQSSLILRTLMWSAPAQPSGYDHVFDSCKHCSVWALPLSVSPWIWFLCVIFRLVFEGGDILEGLNLHGKQTPCPLHSQWELGSLIREKNRMILCVCWAVH